MIHPTTAPARSLTGRQAVAVAVLACAQLAGRLRERVSARWVATTGLALSAAGEATVVVGGSSRLVLVTGVAVAALGIGAALTAVHPAPTAFTTTFTVAAVTAAAAAVVAVAVVPAVRRTAAAPHH